MIPGAVRRTQEIRRGGTSYLTSCSSSCVDVAGMLDLQSITSINNPACNRSSEL
jgi:hypothetical protein